MLTTTLILLPLLASLITNNFEKIKVKLNISYQNEPKNVIHYYLIKIANCTKCLSFQSSLLINLFLNCVAGPHLMSIVAGCFVLAAATSFAAQEIEEIINKIK